MTLQLEFSLKKSLLIFILGGITATINGLLVYFFIFTIPYVNFIGITILFIYSIILFYLFLPHLKHLSLPFLILINPHGNRNRKLRVWHSLRKLCLTFLLLNYVLVLMYYVCMGKKFLEGVNIEYFKGSLIMFGGYLSFFFLGLTLFLLVNILWDRFSEPETENFTKRYTF